MVGDINVVLAIDGQAKRGTETHRRAGAIGKAGRTNRSCKGGHHTLRRHLADDMVGVVRHKKIALAVAHQTRWAVKGGRGSSAVGVAGCASRRPGQNAPVIVGRGHHRHLEGVDVLVGAIVDGDGHVCHTGDICLMLHREGAGVARTANCQGKICCTKKV